MPSALNLTSDLVTFSEPSFDVVDYVVFAAFLVLSGAIGIFFSCRSQKTTGEYFFGNRQMNPVAVGISTGVSFMSAVSVVGYPAEMFNNGWSLAVKTFVAPIASSLAIVMISQIIHPLKINTMNDYYMMRFKTKAIVLASNLMVIICIFQYMGMCMFGAVIAFSSATGGKISIIVALVIGSVVGIFYTSIGGLKAVVWTDVLQFSIMFIGVVSVLIRTIVDTPGGLATIFEMNRNYSRFEMPSLSLDMTIRHTMWGLTIGSSFNWMMWSMQPGLIQRLVSMERMRDCYIVAAMTCFIFFFFSLIPCWVGINIFGYYAYKGCDVGAAGWIKKNDILVYYIRDRLSYPGFQGLFIAALYAGSLSSLSSGLNSASSIIWNDLIRPCFRQPPSELRATFISKIIVVVFGVLAMFWSYTMLSFGGLILQVGQSIDSSMYGAYFGLFVLAVLFRYANSKGATVGVALSFFFTLWLGLGSLIHGKSHIQNLPTITDNCANNVTASTPNSLPVEASNATCSSNVNAESSLKAFYSVSYLWFPVICISSCVVIGLLVTACTKTVDDVDERLLFPLCRRRKRYSPDDAVELSGDADGEEKQHLSDAVDVDV